jgi:hypothetical protein
MGDEEKTTELSTKDESNIDESNIEYSEEKTTELSTKDESNKDASESESIENNNLYLKKILQTQLEIILTGSNAIKYGEKLPDSLSNISITDINLILEDKNFVINNPDNKNADYNCLMYDNSKGLINNNLKDPTICSTNNESKCTLSALTDKNINDNATANTSKSYMDYNKYIGIGGLNIKKEIVSCSGFIMTIFNQTQ